VHQVPVGRGFATPRGTACNTGSEAVKRLKERASKLPEQRLEFSQAAAILGLLFAHGS
jgi:hypothetical protein